MSLTVNIRKERLGDITDYQLHRPGAFFVFEWYNKTFNDIMSFYF